MKGDEFRNILSRLKASDEESWLNIHSHMDIIIRSWARREKMELEWVASEKGMGNGPGVVMEVYNIFRKELLSGRLMVRNYADYKSAVFTYCQEILGDQYSRFYEMLMASNDKAWQRVYERLYLYAAKWLSERNTEGEIARIIYQESLHTLFEKLKSGALSFETSREFKSYYFKILEYKSMEEGRKRVLKRQRLTRLDSGHLSRVIPEDPFEADDRYLMIKSIMRNSISKDEAFILKQYYFQEEKLSVIAKVLGISDGNCRQKKLQALRKIASLYQNR